jgi:predicted unusual protein kinase regulating ubiquinone biosynthesis (AarF/ABC1/UbiB family)
VKGKKGKKGKSARGRALVEAPRSVLREIGALTYQTYRVSKSFGPLVKLLSDEKDVTRPDLAAAMDAVFEALYAHPVTRSAERITAYLRKRNLIPNEQSTEELMRFVIDQLVQRSPVPVPEALVKEFWAFFEELFSSKELKGLGELTLDMVRLVLRTYEPLLVETANVLKAGVRFNQWQLQELMRRAATVRGDVTILRRQVKAIRYLKPFFETDPKDFTGQARIVAQMVREFGPFFIKMAQVAAANADFLPDEIAKELAVFHEDVPAMSADEVNQAFIETFGKLPTERYPGFDAAAPVRSGSIGSVYVAKKAFVEDGKEVLRQVVIKVGRQNIDREFVIGKLVIGLAIMSTQYWAPHSKVAPFLRALQEQVDEFVAGFSQELDFDAEARNQQRFRERAAGGLTWRVPMLYGSSRRILEMEYLEDAKSLVHALRALPRRKRRDFQRQISERLLYTVLSHIFVHQEIHGDLHPGNIMIGSDGALYLIDWGNTVALDGKWPAVWDYLAGAVLADPDLLTDALINISTQPEANRARRREIRKALVETLEKKKVEPLTGTNFVRVLRKGGLEGLHRRGQAVLHLMSNTQSTGIVLTREYLHLSRALMATIGSFSSLYEDSPKRLLLQDLAGGVIRMPVRYTRERVNTEVTSWRARAARVLPLPSSVRSRWLPAPLPVPALPT